MQMYMNLHIVVYTLCLEGKEKKYFFSLPATKRILLLSLEHLIASILSKIKPFSSTFQGSLHVHLSPHLGSHFPVLPLSYTSVLFCCRSQCPVCITPCYSPPFSMLLFCLEIHLALESKSLLAHRSYQSCQGRPTRQEALHPVSPSCLCICRELSG